MSVPRYFTYGLSRCLLLVLLVAFTLASLAENIPALAALNEGRADDAARLLRSQISSNQHDAGAHQLLCRVFYSQELADEAIRECEMAVTDAPSNSNDCLWLGRAYGLKASRANPISAFALARKVVAAFERAVQLDGSNVAALRDLGEYYVAAPAIVGGGLDKAQLLATRTMSISQTKAHRLFGQIAEKKGDNAKAEVEFKRAVESQRSPESYVDLADFYQRLKLQDQSYGAVQAAVRLDRAKDDSLVDAASVLVAIGRDTPLAEQLLMQYLNSSARTDSAPAAKVHVQLGDLLLKRGDKDRARKEYEAALALASQYAPARKALQSLQTKALR